ncbi:MAG: PAS domain S-box protein [Deltaproteobacteria bacterium]|nr:PAS domain S-box protein [Deltaproteobacteria bacterium]MBW2069166.1 PAS domain S-box protein [Deltaproteobacteria bacterium]
MHFYVFTSREKSELRQWKDEFKKRGHSIFFIFNPNEVIQIPVSEDSIFLLDIPPSKIVVQDIINMLQAIQPPKSLIIYDCPVDLDLPRWAVKYSPNPEELVESILNSQDQCLHLGTLSDVHQMACHLLHICSILHEQLVEEEIELKIISNVLPVIIYKGECDWSVKFFGSAIEKITGYSAREFEEKRITWKHLIISEDLRKAKAAVAEALKKGGNYVREYRIRRANGEVRWIRDIGKIMLKPPGDRLSFYGIAIDVTTEKQFIEIIERGKREWEQTFDTVPNLIALIDKNFIIRRINKPFANRLNKHPRELIGCPCWETYCHKANPLPCDIADDLKAGRTICKTIDHEILKGHFIYHVTPLKDAEGNFNGALCTYTDITAFKKAKDELNAMYSELQAVINAVSAIVIAIDENGIVYRWNRQAENYFGIRASVAVGSSLEDLTKELPIAEYVKSASETGQSVSKEIKTENLNGRISFLEVLIHPYKKTDSGKHKILIVAFDITEKKHMEMQVAHSQKLQAIGTLAAGIAHEINSPAQCIAANLPFIQESFTELLKIISQYQELGGLDPSSPRRLELLKNIKKSEEEIDIDFLTTEIPQAIQQSIECITQIQKIVSSIRDFSHPLTPKRQWVDINKSIQSVVNLTKNEWKRIAEVSLKLDPKLPLLYCSPTEINQVLLNLVVNALQAIQEKKEKNSNFWGRLTLETSLNGPWCEIKISDNGVGIPDTIKDKVFEPFFTTKDPGMGTGQGLAIAQAIVVRGHSGQIFFNSKEGKGTEFVIRLPLKSQQDEDGEVK